MRRLILLPPLLGLLLAVPARGQAGADTLARRGAATPSVLTSLQAFDAERTRLDQRGLRVLGAWAVGNLLVSGIAANQTEGSARYFHQMNVG